MLSICFLIFISWLSSFSNNKTLYSCDPEINSWMINNIEEIEKISLNNLLEEDPLFQKVIFSALSPKKKAEIFNEKIDFVLNLNWSNAQRNAIKKFGKFIDEDLYRSGSNKSDLETWVEVAKGLFTDEEIYYIAFSFDKLKKEYKEKSIGHYSPPCECSRAFPNLSPCGLPVVPGQDTTQCGFSLCGVQLSACGPAGAFDCDGMCLPVRDQ